MQIWLDRRSCYEHTNWLLVQWSSWIKDLDLNLCFYSKISRTVRFSTTTEVLHNRGMIVHSKKWRRVKYLCRQTVVDFELIRSHPAILSVSRVGVWARSRHDLCVVMMRTNILWVVTVTRRQTTITSYFAENILTCHKFILSLLSSELANYLSLSLSLFNLSLSIYIYTYIHTYTYIYIYKTSSNNWPSCQVAWR